MHWTEPATSEDSHGELEKKLWDAANMLWAGADLKPSEYSPTVLGLIYNVSKIDKQRLAGDPRDPFGIPRSDNGNYACHLTRPEQLERCRRHPILYPVVERSGTTGPISQRIPHPGSGASLSRTRNPGRLEMTRTRHVAPRMPMAFQRLAASKHHFVGVNKTVRDSIPSLPTQRKSAGILSAYDDLIENNLRRIRILEEMAQSLYREWFVHFRLSPCSRSSVNMPSRSSSFH